MFIVAIIVAIWVAVNRFCLMLFNLLSNHFLTGRSGQCPPPIPYGHTGETLPTFAIHAADRGFCKVASPKIMRSTKVERNQGGWRMRKREREGKT